MDFAKRMLEKYGWSEGQGLGKDSTGITTALKPKVKLNTFGLGHDSAQEFTYRWWEDAFNDAACNVYVKNTEDGVRVDTLADKSVEISAVKRSKIKRDKAQFGTFIKRETLTNDGLEQALESESEPVEERLSKLPATLTDEQLFEACGGLTAHKAARHGHKLSGKLQRVREQEEALLQALKKNQMEESNNCDGSERKRKKNKYNSEKKISSELEFCAVLNSSYIKERKPCESLYEKETTEKAKKKKRKLETTEKLQDGELIEASGKKTSDTREQKKKQEKLEKEVIRESETNVLPYDVEKSEKSKKKKEKREVFPEEVSCESTLSERKQKKKKQKTEKT